jgi:Flp pilus assembly protein TadG
MTKISHRAPGRDRGSVAVELVVLVPALILIVGVMTAGWRMSSARTEVLQAAQAGARAASLAASSGAARAAAEAAVSANLGNAGITCADQVIEVDVSAFALPAGHSGSVRVTVHCTVALADLMVPGLPGTISAAGTGTAVLDTYHRRQP